VGIDVGGARGLLPHWRTLDGIASFYLFEPHPESFKRLQDFVMKFESGHLYKILPTALSGTGGTRTLHLTNTPSGSTLLPLLKGGAGREYIEEDYFFPMRELKLETHTLREVFDEVKEPNVDLIKLDIQGAEFEVLVGFGEDRIQQLVLVEMEIGLQPLYEGQKSFGEVDVFLRERGFDLFDVRVSRTHRPMNGRAAGYQKQVFSVYENAPGISARLWEFDAIYFRNPKSLLMEKNRGEIRKLIVAYCTYNFFIEAFCLIERAEAAEAFSQAEADKLKEAVVCWYKRAHYSFIYQATPFYERLRSTLQLFALKGHRRWAQHMWVDYPNC
jgi:FkbM family methyltransferase